MGLSPRRTRRLLDEVGLSLDAVDHALITHFDSDHFYRGWVSALPSHIVTHVHEQHAAKARKVGLKTGRINAFADSVLLDEARVSVSLMAHDAAGVSAFRVDHLGVSLGYATDVGTPTPRLTDHLAGVDLLAVESNYCPQLQAASNRPAFLKQRIMGGAGHLSNQQCVQLAEDIGPRSEVVLLHLSRQCNRPDLAEKGHRHASYRLTVSSQIEPTRWISVAPKVSGGLVAAGAEPSLDAAGAV